MQLETLLEVNHSITLSSAFMYNWEFIPGWERVNGHWRFNKAKAGQPVPKNQTFTFNDFDMDFLDPNVSVDDVNVRPLRNVRLINRFTPLAAGNAEDNFFRAFFNANVMGIKIIPRLFAVVQLVEQYMQRPSEDILDEIAVELEAARKYFMGLVKGFRMIVCSSPLELHKVGLPPGFYTKAVGQELRDHTHRMPYKKKVGEEWIDNAAIQPEMLKIMQSYASWDDNHPVVHGKVVAVGASGFQVEIFHILDHFLGNEFNASVTRDKEDNVEYGMDPRSRNTIREMLLKKDLLKQFRNALTQGTASSFKSSWKVLRGFHSLTNEVLLFRGSHLNRVRQYSFLDVKTKVKGVSDRTTGKSTMGSMINDFEHQMSHIHERTAVEVLKNPASRCPFAKMGSVGKTVQPESILPVGEDLMYNQNLRAYSWDEVGINNTKESVWIVIDGIVFDITYWLPQHPGGLSPMGWAGLDATYHFWKVANHRWFKNQPDRWIVQKNVEPMIYKKPGSDDVLKVEMTDTMVNNIMRGCVIVRMKDLPVFAVGKIPFSEKFVALSSVIGVDPYTD